ncbi:MAG: hypothetical protein Q7S00_01730 [bacterium]|nr:hypothetical protein [bacterium]
MTVPRIGQKNQIVSGCLESEGNAQNSPSPDRFQDASPKSHLLWIPAAAAVVVGMAFVRARSVGTQNLRAFTDKLIDRVFPKGPERVWLLRGWPETFPGSGLPAKMPVDFSGSFIRNPSRAVAMKALGHWHDALRHRFGHQANLMSAFKEYADQPEILSEFRPQLVEDGPRIWKLLDLLHELEQRGLQVLNPEMDGEIYIFRRILIEQKIPRPDFPFPQWAAF